jgi:hypothetical protein
VSEARIPDWLSASDFVLESERAAGRLVLVPVRACNAGARAAARRALEIPAQERRALHVVRNTDAATRLARRWTATGFDLPLTFVEHDQGIPFAIARVVRFELSAGCKEVVVIAGRRALDGLAARLLDDRMADRIARAVIPIPEALAGIVVAAAA